MGIALLPSMRNTKYDHCNVRENYAVFGLYGDDMPCVAVAASMETAIRCRDPFQNGEHNTFPAFYVAREISRTTGVY